MLSRCFLFARLPGVTNFEGMAGLRPIRLLLVLAWLLLGAGGGMAQEVQSHGLAFERWVCDTFFDGYRPSRYTQKWDIPAEANTRHGGLPVNPKAVKYGTPVGLGDALQQFDIDEPFILILGYWQQVGGEKRFVNIVAVTVTPEQWRKLWGSITRPDLEKLDAVIKDRSLDYREARRQAQALKRTAPYNQSLIVLNPKIDSKTQRRLQCSLRFKDIFTHLAPETDSSVQAEPVLWGVPVGEAVTSGPRSFGVR
jgi:hypothetical protein